jgi:acyl-coenzyme A synthetase/AMP-(fatty) acid ligase
LADPPSTDLTGVLAAGLQELLGPQAAELAPQLARARSATHDQAARQAWQALLRSATGRLTIHSSGTTGQPQAVQHTAASLLRGVQGDPKHHADVWGLTYAANTFAFWQVALQAIFNLNPLVDLNRLPPTDTLAQIDSGGVTHLSGTPTFYRQLVDAAPPTHGVRAVTTGGETLDKPTLDGIRRQFPAAKIRNVYASTQAGVLLTSDSEVFNLPSHRRNELIIRSGELWVCQRLLGQSPDLTMPDGDPFYATGDLVEIVAGDVADPQASLQVRFVGRRSQLIHVGGAKVSPERVESAILRLIPGIKAAHVYGQPNSVTGQIVTCQVVLQPPHTAVEPAEFRRLLAAELQPAEMPRCVQVVDHLETTASGKVKRAAVEGDPGSELSGRIE